MSSPERESLQGRYPQARSLSTGYTTTSVPDIHIHAFDALISGHVAPRQVKQAVLTLKTKWDFSHRERCSSCQKKGDVASMIKLYPIFYHNLTTESHRKLASKRILHPLNTLFFLILRMPTKNRIILTPG